MKTAILLLIVTFSIIGCNSSRQSAFNLQSNDIQSQIDTVQVEENGEIENVEVVGHSTLINFNNDTIRLYISAFLRSIPDSLLPPISNQLNWLNKNQNKVIKKFKKTNNINQAVSISTLSSDIKGNIVIYFKQSGKELEQKLKLTLNKELEVHNEY